MSTHPALFEGKTIRRLWNAEEEQWYFSVVDVVAVLTESNNPQVYWRVLKKRLMDQGSSETVTKCNALKMRAIDGKMRLTDEITDAWAGMTTRQYKAFKGLRKENLRDNMTNLELVLNMLAETATTEISQQREPKTWNENKKVAREGGGIAGNARKQIEEKTGKKVISPKKFAPGNPKLLHE